MPEPQLKKIPQYFKKAQPNSEGWSAVSPKDRDWEEAYRSRWQHDKIVRSTHGVNCTGSCSWKVYVKDGIITWETQQTDYPTNGPGMPEYEPRGCPRGASFSWYIYSPLRVRYPYVRGALWRLWREALDHAKGDPVEAWRSIVEDPVKATEYKSARGMGGFIRAKNEDLYSLISASLIYTIKKYGPDRIFAFTPIPAMSMVSYSSGTRFVSLIGGCPISFYDTYCDLPAASPEVWGEQTDVPESADWFNSTYILMWGANVPVTRTPDAHFMVEARYKGTKVVAISPDYTEDVKFGDLWVPVKPGTDGALGIAMTHVILKEFYVDRKVEYFERYVSTYTDLPFLVTLRRDPEGYVSANFLVASDLGIDTPNSDWKGIVWDGSSKKFSVPNGSVGFRWSAEGKWNLEMVEDGKEIRPSLTFLDQQDELVSVCLPHFEDDGTKRVLHRSVPAKRLRVKDGDVYVTTVFDLLLAQVGVSRSLPGDYPADYDDPMPGTPAWQESITGVDRSVAAQIAREFAKNAELTNGKSMIIMGSGINHWYHNDEIYRAILSLVMLTGCQGVNGGGWAHYVGQEKVRPLEGWSALAFATDWTRPTRQQNGTSFFYFATDQWRYEQFNADELASPLARRYGGLHFADYNVLAVRLGWLPSYPQFNANPIDLVADAEAAGAKDEQAIVNRIAEKLEKKELRFAIENPDDPANIPRVLFVWRANVISSFGKGHEYFLKHLLGTKSGIMATTAPRMRPTYLNGEGAAQTGKLDLLIDLNFRMDGTALYSDIVLPAATWYEKHDISTTDLHPFVHPFDPAIDPPWESRTDWDAFKGLAKVFSDMSPRYFSSATKDLVAVPLMHDTVDEIAQPRGRVHDWSQGDGRPIPGKTTQKLFVVERDYTKVYDKMTSLGPLIVEKGMGAKGVSYVPREEYEQLKKELGTSKEGVTAGCPKIETALKAAETILALSGATNGSISAKGWRSLEKATGERLENLVEGSSEVRIRFQDIVQQPKRTMTSPVWSGIEREGRQYTAFAINLERKVPWRTFTGRQHFYLDHELMLEFGEALPLYRPPLTPEPFLDGEMPGTLTQKLLRVRWITPHNKWSIHTTYVDNLTMLTLFRGGPTIWLNNEDAAKAGISDNDWVEALNRNGVMVARAVVSHRIPKGAAYSYHAQEKTVNVPGSETTGERGGVHNSVTKFIEKPTQMIGGYAQFSYGFNYWGPTASDRDSLVLVKKTEKVSWLED